LFGALSAAIITLPMSIGYGIIAYAPLGHAFSPQAAILGVYSAVLSGLMAGIFGGTPIQISGPKAPLTLVLAAFVAGMTAKLSLPLQAPPKPEMVLALAGACVMIAGFCQVIMGALGFGNLVKYAPQPVVAGFMNGIAFLLIVKQIKPILGIETKTPLVALIQDMRLVCPQEAVVGLATIAIIFLARHCAKQIPASLIGLVLGSLLYFGLFRFAENATEGHVLGQLETTIPSPEVVLLWFTASFGIPYRPLLAELLATGLILGLLASMESLLASVASDNMTGSRHDSKKELIGQGLGNMVCGLFGALPAAGSIPRSVANYRGGGRTPLSGLMCSLIIFLLIFLLAPLVSKIPLTVMAGIIVVVGILLFDQWSLNLLTRLIADFKSSKAVLDDVIITLVVAIVTVSINLIVAVAVGVLIASAMFIARMGRSIIKRKFLGSHFHSRKMRSLEDTETLEKTGEKIQIIELQGPLFFGSSEKLALEIEKDMYKAVYFILNFKRISDIDSTGGNILSQIKKRLEERKKYLLLCNLKGNPQLWSFLQTVFEHKLLDGRYIFNDTDSALEWAEDHLLGRTARDCISDHVLDLSKIELFKDFSAQEFKTLKANLVPMKFSENQKVFDEGDSSRDLFIITRGSMSVKIHLPERNRQRRIITYAPGTVFGEMAFLDGSLRSAGVWAHENSEVLCLRFDQFENLKESHSGIATKLMINLSIELSRRLRMSSNQIRILEDS